MRVLELDHRFRSAIPLLLPQIGTDRRATMMPDQRRRRVTDLQTGIDEPPADVHIISGDAKLLIKSAKAQQRIPFECHVAAGNVLRLAVIDHDMAWIAGTDRDTPRGPVIARWSEIWAADRIHLLIDHASHEIRQPSLVGHAIAIGVSDNLAGGGVRPRIAGGAEAAIFLANQPEFRKTRCDLRSSISRSIVNDNHLIV